MLIERRAKAVGVIPRILVSERKVGWGRMYGECPVRQAKLVALVEDPCRLIR